MGVLLACQACSSNSTTTAVDPKPTFPVQGSLLMDGKAISRVLVILHPQDDPEGKRPRSYARTDAGGSFVVSTYKPGDGAPAGTYIVTVMLQDADDETQALPARLASVKTSELRMEVREGSNQLEPFRLRRR